MLNDVQLKTHIVDRLNALGGLADSDRDHAMGVVRGLALALTGNDPHYIRAAILFSPGGPKPAIVRDFLDAVGLTARPSPHGGTEYAAV